MILPAPTYPSWNSSAKKYAAGARVQYLGVIWEASRDINGQEPGKGKFWTQVEVVSYPLWTSNDKYATGDRVTSDGQVWEASRAINGQKPGVGTFWTLIGSA